MIKKFSVRIEDESPQYGDARNPSITVFRGEFSCTKEMMLKILEALGILFQGNVYRFIVSTEKVETVSIEFGGLGPNTKKFPTEINL